MKNLHFFGKKYGNKLELVQAASVIQVFQHYKVKNCQVSFTEEPAEPEGGRRVPLPDFVRSVNPISTNSLPTLPTH